MCGCLSRAPSWDLARNPGMCPKGNQTRDPLVRRPALNPLSDASQGSGRIFYSPSSWALVCSPYDFPGAATCPSIPSLKILISSLHLLSHSCLRQPPCSALGGLAMTFKALNQVLLPRIVPAQPWAATCPAASHLPPAVHPGELLQAVALTPMH